MTPEADQRPEAHFSLPLHVHLFSATSVRNITCHSVAPRLFPLVDTVLSGWPCQLWGLFLCLTAQVLSMGPRGRAGICSSFSKQMNPLAILFLGMISIGWPGFPEHRGGLREPVLELKTDFGSSFLSSLVMMGCPARMGEHPYM